MGGLFDDLLSDGGVGPVSGGTEQVVDHHFAERDTVLNCRRDRVGALGFEQRGGVQAVGQFEVGGVKVGGGEVPEGFWAEVQPAGSLSVATAMRSRPLTRSMLVRSSLIWLMVSAVPMGARPTASPLLPRVMARASMGPSTMTGSAPSVRRCRASAYPKSASPLVNTGVVRVLRYFGPAQFRPWSSSVLVGLRRPMNPRIAPPVGSWGSRMGMTSRSRKKSR